MTAVRFESWPPGAPGSGSADGAAVDAALLAGARQAAGDVSAALELARRWGRQLPEPGAGRTGELWQALAGVGAADLTVARVAEPHLDALAILRQARDQGQLDASAPQVAAALDGTSTLGVYAAEAPGARLEAAPTAGGDWRLTGTKAWCSLADRLDQALVTAWTGPATRRIFLVDLGTSGLTSDPSGWVARGLSAVTSGSITLDDVPALPVGSDGWYLDRPGFAWGGIGVAACWFGGAVAVVRRLAAQGRQRDLDQIGQAHLGAADVALHAAGATLAAAGRAVDAGIDGQEAVALALRCRGTVRRAAEEVLDRAAHALGPAPLAREEEHARRVADLGLYLRQEHAERDDAALGRLLDSDPRRPAVSSVWGAASALAGVPGGGAASALAGVPGGGGGRTHGA